RGFLRQHGRQEDQLQKQQNGAFQDRSYHIDDLIFVLLLIHTTHIRGQTLLCTPMVGCLSQNLWRAK
ncbi:MAG: hypothetical protein KDC30_05795, partial [Saprospiraceae bacterium]|nr:hypothetical protein [Saprospiraceae bacterium]